MHRSRLPTVDQPYTMGNVFTKAFPTLLTLTVPTMLILAQIAVIMYSGRAWMPFLCAAVPSLSAILLVMTKSCSNTCAMQCTPPSKPPNQLPPSCSCLTGEDSAALRT
eukprot:1154114-Pelagomonas_calceolata.AAC.7